VEGRCVHEKSELCPTSCSLNFIDTWNTCSSFQQSAESFAVSRDDDMMRLAASEDP